MWPMVWAQTGPDEAALSILALRRWFGSLTLSAPEVTPRPLGLWTWLLGLAAILFLAIAFQGPKRAFGQLLNVVDHSRRLAATLDRLRRSGRLVVLLLGVTVIAWTGYLFPRHNRPDGLLDLAALTRTKAIGEVAFEQGVLAALTPARDLLGLGDVLALLLPATVIAFRLAAERWSHGMGGAASGRGVPAIASLGWGALGLFALYRVTQLIVSTDDLPLGNCLVIESAVIPLLTLIADGVLAAWVFTELAHPGRGGQAEALQPAEVLNRAPAAMLACLACLPARYIGLMAFLLTLYVPRNQAQQFLEPLILRWGLVYLQGLGLVGLAIVGPSAFGGSWPRVLARTGRFLRASGGRLAAWVALCGAAAGAAAGVAYLLLLSLPPEPWVVGAADEYAHFASLPFGLLLVAGLVDMAAELPPEPTAEAGEIAWQEVAQSPLHDPEDPLS